MINTLQQKQFQDQYNMNLLTAGYAMTGAQPPMGQFSPNFRPSQGQTIQSVFGLVMGNMYGGGSLEDKQMRNRAIMEAFGVSSDDLYRYMSTPAGKNAMAMAASGYSQQRPMQMGGTPSGPQTTFKKTIDARSKSYIGMGSSGAGMIAYEGGGLSAKENWELGNRVPRPNYIPMSTSDAARNRADYFNRQRLQSSTSMSPSNRAQSSSSPAPSFGMYPRAPLPAPPSSVTMPTTQAGMDYYRQSFFDSLKA